MTRPFAAMVRLPRTIYLAATLAVVFTSSALASPISELLAKGPLRDLQGEPIDLRVRWIVIVFLSPECPVANAGIPVLNALAKEFEPAGIRVIGVYADPSIEPSALRKHAEDYHLGFATGDDRRQQMLRATGAIYTPETFVYSREGKLLYRGRIDDRVKGFGPAKPAATHEDLREVLTALVAGNNGPFENKPGFGCTIPIAETP